MLFKEEEKEKEEEEGEELAVVIIMELERIRNEAVISHISDHGNNRLFDLSNPQIWVPNTVHTQISNSDIQLRYPTQISNSDIRPRGWISGCAFQKNFFFGRLFILYRKFL